MSAPMSDAFLVLAQVSGGLTCFLMPRFRPDGTVNGIRLQRLKDKLGNRSNASAEVEFVDAFAWRVGEEGAGIRTILQMVQLTRLDCAIASAGLMRMALAQAAHHARERSVFGRKLAEQPMMRVVLADLALDLEASVALVFRLARAHDQAAADPRERAYARLLTPAVKFLVCKLAPQFIYEAMECLGGNGYVEESLLPRLYREAPVNAIWEGSGNVMGLDVLRALRAKDSPDLDARDLLEHLSSEAGVAPEFGEVDEGAGRRVTERIALVAAAAALRGSAPEAIASAFIHTRLDRPRGALYGTARLDPAVVTTLNDRIITA
jgi:putative acyl-CoA dehydrogenase